MKLKLPALGIKVIEIPRKSCEGNVISAKRIRTLIDQGNIEEIKKMVPSATYEICQKHYIVPSGRFTRANGRSDNQ